MAQFGYPTSDITAGAWTHSTGASHFGVLDEVSFDDADYIQLNNQTANACEVRLNTLTDPNLSTGHTLHLRVKKTGSGTITLTAALIENTTIRATRNPTLTTAYADVSFTLTGAEADAITDYTNLRIRFTGTCAASTRFIYVSWANLEVPNVANNYVLQTTTGVFTLTGNNALVSRGLKVLGSVGSFAWTGNNAILTYLRKLILQTNTGVFIWTGNNAILDWHVLTNYVLLTTPGSFSWTGNNALLSRGLKILGSPGAFNLTGNDVKLLRGLKILSDSGSFVWTRNNALELYNRKILTTPGSFAWTGNNSVELWKHLMKTTPGQFTWAGLDAILTYQTVGAYILQTTPGVFALDGKNSILAEGHLLKADTGIFTRTGYPAVLLYERKLLGQIGIFTLNGYPSLLLLAYLLLASEGVFVFTGYDAKLLKGGGETPIPIDLLKGIFIGLFKSINKKVNIP